MARATARASAVGAPLLATVSACAIVVGLTWPLALDPTRAIPDGFFHGGHVWVLDHIASMLTGERPLETRSEMLGFPRGADLRPIGLVPAVLFTLLRPFVGVILAYDLVLVASFGLAALAAHALLRTLGGGPWTAAAGATVYAVCPFALGALASGQLAVALVLPSCCCVGLRCPRSMARGPVDRSMRGGRGVHRADADALAPTGGVPVLLDGWVRQWSGGLRARVHATGAMAVAVGATAGVMWLARGFFQSEVPLDEQAFIPAVRLAGGRVDELSPVATLGNLLWRTTPPERVDWRTVSHVATLGLPMLLVALPLGVWRARSRWAGLALALIGGSLALGPRLVSEAGPVTIGGQAIALPAALLDAVATHGHQRHVLPGCHRG